MLEQDYQFQEFTCEWLRNPKYSAYRPLFTTQDEWTIVKYVKEVLRPFRYSTMWMSKRQPVTLHYIFRVYNDMFDHMDGIMRSLAKNKTEWKADLFFAMKLVRQKLSNYYAEVTPKTGMLLISTQMLGSVRKLRSFRKRDKQMDINPEDETSYTTQYKDAFLMYVENGYRAKHRCAPVNNPENVPSSNLVPPAMTSRSGQSSFDLYDSSSNDEAYLMHNTAAETSPGRSDCAARLLPTARLHLKSPLVAPKNQGQINPNLNEYHTNPIQISSTLWLPERTDWWCQHNGTHSKYAVLSNAARNILCIIPHGVGVESNFCLGQDVIGWRQSKTTGETFRENGIVRQFAPANNGIKVGNGPALNTTNTEYDLEMKKEVEEWTLPRMAKVHDILEMGQGSQNLSATQKESRAQNTQTTAIG